MTYTNLPMQLTTLLISLAFTSVVIAADATTNENKNNSTSNTVSDVNTTSITSSNTQPVIEKQASSAPNSQVADTRMQHIREIEKFQQMEKEWYQKRRESYRQQLENKRQLNTAPASPVDMELRRNEYIKHMEKRREFFNKMNEQRRKEFEQRRKEIQLKMHHTSTQSNTDTSS